MPLSIHKKRIKTHQKVVLKLAEMVSTVTAFFLIFSVLLTLSNWPAYSKVMQNWIDPEVMAKRIEIPKIDPAIEAAKKENELRKKIVSEINPDFQAAIKQRNSKQLFDLSDMGILYPDEMRLEIPGIFEGIIPVKEVEETDFDFANFYESENKIQEALREGVVHYPYTSNPHQYGNVFITGHSSYYPWDKGQYKDIFALLHTMEIGDEYFIYFENNKYKYQVTEIFEIEADDISALEQPIDQRISTLMTCTPLGTVLRRLIVRGELVGD